MLDIVYNLQSLTPVQLDKFLDNGWFRMHQHLTSTYFIMKEDRIFATYGLRIDLFNYVPSKTHKKLQKVVQKFFVKVQPLQLSSAQHQLYRTYKNSVPMDISNDIYDLLFNHSAHNVFDTWQVELWDGSRLIACGYFDKGYKSLAGIVCFFHPDYRSMSPGKCLMYQKIAYGINQGMDYFYPGYFAPGIPAFDYKLTLAPNFTYFFQRSSHQWLPLSVWDPANVHYLPLI